jgi:hypothetical protein
LKPVLSARSYLNSGANIHLQTTCYVLELTFVAACPSTVYVSTSASSCDAVVQYTLPTATDNCAVIGPNLTMGPESGSTVALGNSSVTYATQDEAGHISTCTFAVVVQDTIPPEISTYPCVFTCTVHFRIFWVHRQFLRVVQFLFLHVIAFLGEKILMLLD